MSATTALVVEDDKAIQQLLRDALEAEGFQVILEKDGEWALRQLDRRLPDVLVTDVLLPSVSGFDLVTALRAMEGGAHVPVVMISGIYRGKRHHKTARETLGVAAYLDKPFEISALVSTLKTVLGEQYPGAAARRARAPSTDKARQKKDDPFADRDSRLEREEVESAARALDGAARTARGNLRHKRFPEVLSQLYRWRATGALLLRRERVKKIVYLKEGYPIFVKSNLLSECLGRVMVRERIISEEECEKSLALMKESGRQQGTILIEQGIISPHNLVYSLQLQLEEKLFDIFGWNEGDYQFSPKIDIPPQAVHVDMSLATIVYEGIRRSVTAKQLKDILEPFQDSFLIVHEDPLHRFQEISLEADERNLVALIDGRRPLHEVVSRSTLPPLLAQKLIYALLSAEMIQPVTKRSRRKDSLLPGAALKDDEPPPLRRKPKRNDAPQAGGAEPLLTTNALDAFDADDLRAKLALRIKGMRRMSAFEVLGVSKRASVDEIRRAFFAVVKDVHPDNFRAMPADVRDLAAQIHNELTRANDMLADEESRAAYQKKLDDGTRTGVTDEVGKILAAEGRFTEGERALSVGDFALAQSCFQSAADLYPDEGEFFSYLGWAMFERQRASSEPFTVDDKTAIEAFLREGITKSPRAETGYVFLGRALKTFGRTDEALRQFELALQANPDCVEAVKELALVDDRKLTPSRD